MNNNLLVVPNIKDEFILYGWRRDWYGEYHYDQELCYSYDKKDKRGEVIRTIYQTELKPKYSIFMKSQIKKFERCNLSSSELMSFINEKLENKELPKKFAPVFKKIRSESFFKIDTKF